MFIKLNVSYLARVTAFCSQLVDLGLCNVCTLLSLLQLVLDLPALGQMSIGLFLLENKQKKSYIQKNIYIKISLEKTQWSSVHEILMT